MASSSRLPHRAAARGSQRRSAFSRSLDKGYAAIQRGDFATAVQHYERAVSERPGSAMAHNDLGNAYRCAWKLDDALASYRRAIAADPTLATAHHNLGVTLLATADVEGAIVALEAAHGLRPGHADTLISLSEAYGRAGREADRIAVAGRLQSLATDSLGNEIPSIDLALAYHHLGRRAEAIDCFRAVIASDPSSFDAARLLGLLLIEDGRYPEALSAFEHALSVRPDSAEVAFYRSLELLRAGEFENGFAEYENRWRYADFTSPRRDYGVPEWDGNADRSLTRLLHTEQGIGDTFQFIRFVAGARARVGRIVLECEPGIARLVSGCDGIDEVVPKGAMLPPVDAHLPLLSLPHRLGVTGTDLPRSGAYLHVDGDSPLLSDSRSTVGIVWAGSPTHVNDANRSCSLSDFEPLLDIEGMRFVSLQVGRSAELAQGPEVFDAAGLIGDWSDTARIIDGLDLVITVDTAVAHLAGAMGKPVWVLLPFAADWRWMTDREDSPWYPTMRLFRQATPGDWAGVFRNVRRSLRSAARTSTPNAMSQPARESSALDLAVARFRDAVQKHCRQDLAGAEALYREAILLHPEIPEAHNNLGAILGDTGRKAEARMAFARAVELNPDYGEALNNLGLLLRAAGEIDDAVDCLERAIRTAPQRVDWINNLGNAYLEEMRIQEALELYDRSIAIDPGFAFARNNRAVALRGLGRFDESIRELEALLEHNPDYFEAINNLGLALRDSGRRKEAIDIFERALSIAPDAQEARINLGVTFQELGRHEEARQVARDLLERDPSCYDAWDIIGHCAYEDGDYDLAYEFFGRAIELQPKDVNAHWNRALLDLHRGRLREGFAGYEWRKKLVAFTRNRRPVYTPEWDGPPLNWQSILVISEQGLGDALQFVRYAAALKDAGAGAVHVECDPVLADLLMTAPGIDSVVPRGQSLPEHDVHVYMLSLPGLLGTDVDSIPDTVPYLTAPERKAADAVATDGLAVGFVWAGSPGHARDHLRSARLELFDRLFEVPGTTFHSLQKGGPEAALAGVRRSNVRDLSKHLADFGDTAAVVERLDLVITVDTSVAHLAGALGKQTWLLLPHVCDFRWQIEGETSPWYPTMRIFRQPAVGDWESVFDRTREELERLVSEGRGVAPTDAVPRPYEAPTTTGRTGRVHAATERLQVFAVAAAGVLDPRESDPAGRILHDVLKELLRDGDTFIDVDAGTGSLALTAVESDARIEKVIAITQPERATLVKEMLAEHDPRSPIEVIASEYPEDSAHLVGVSILRGGRTIVSWGAASSILGTPAGRSTLVDNRLAAVLWRTTAAGNGAEIAAVLSGAGFDHFRVERDDDGLLLEAHSDFDAPMETIVSLRTSRIDEFRSPTDIARAGAPPVEDRWVETSPIADSGARHSTDQSVGGGEPGGYSAPATVIGIDWPIGGTSGWQVYGTNLATHLATRDGIEPRLAFLPDTRELPPIARFALGETIELSRRPYAGHEMLALRALGNGIEASSVPCWPGVKRNAGVIFFEDTRISPDALERGRRYDVIVAGSSWNAEVLRANGLDNVELSLQGIDPTLFHPAAPSGLFGDRFVIFSGGKLEYRKGQDIVVSAFREFQRMHPEALLLFAWHNHWPQIMEEITYGGHVRSVPSVDSHGGIDFATWLFDHGLPNGSFLDLGIVPNAQMGQLLREAHVGLFPNRGEGGTNLVAMELMACGVPAVLSANTGHLDLLGESGAYPLIEQGKVAPSRHCPGNEGWGESSVDEIIEVLERIYTDREEAAERAARSATFMKRLSWANQVEHLITTLSPLF